ncbi:MAG: TerB N-terminal domain-containing protein [Pirellulales bacterium]
MGQVWYCLIDGTQLGPIDSKQLRDLADRGQLRPIHFVRQNVGHKWTSAAQVKGLFQDTIKQDGQSHTEQSPQSRWFVRVAGQESGPYSDNQLRHYVAAGLVLANHDVRLKDRTEWIKADRIKNLFPAPVPPTQPLMSSPTATTKVRFACPSCGKFLQCQPTLAGKSLPCPACRVLVLVPKPGTDADTQCSKSTPSLPTPRAAPIATDNDPVTIQVPTTRPAGEGIGGFSLRNILGNLKFTVSSGSEKDARPSKESIKFYGPQSVVDLGYGPLPAPLVYATTHRFSTVFDASLIELPLSTTNKSFEPDPLPYWPTYHDCTPHQRAKYLEWLYQGRSDPAIEIGYVFLFFYGLERRVLVDGQDHYVVVEELLRLLSIYTHSRSFINYTSALLWITVYLSADTNSLSDDLVMRVVKATAKWNEAVFRYCLGYFSRQNKPLPREVVYAVANHDERSRNSVVTRRHTAQFRELFTARFTNAYPGGFTLRPGSRERKIEYQPASGTLLASRQATRELATRKIPDVLAARAQFSPLVQIWNDCVDELKAYDRATRQGTQPATTGAMYEALPAELRSGDHPELAAWQRLISESVDEGGWPVMLLSELATIKQISRRPQLTKKQSLSLLVTADTMGIAIEPDARLTNRNYRWDEPIVVFRDEGVAPSDTELKAYHSAAVLLRLSLSIAQADGQLDETELRRITEHLEQEFSLGARLSKRLDALMHLLVVQKASEVVIGRVLQKSLPMEQRRLVGQFLLAIAAVDEVVCSQEKKILRKAFRTLGIPTPELDALLATYDQQIAESTIRVEEDASLSPPPLNLARIRAIHEETARVQSLLHDVLSNVDIPNELEDDSADYEAVATLPSADAATNAHEGYHTALAQDVSLPLDRLPERYRDFCSLIVSRDRWPRDEISELAREQGLMLNAALEVLNEWSTDIYGDWLTEEFDTEFVVRKQLIGVPSDA